MPGPLSSSSGPPYMCQPSGVATSTTISATSSSSTRPNQRALATSFSPKIGAQLVASGASPSPALSCGSPFDGASGEALARSAAGKPPQTASVPLPGLFSVTSHGTQLSWLHT